uniref:Transcriptional regulatory protein n=1 Tax=Trieres chinensis TaxID=1514140 RepID=A0A7S2EDJ1_TRICV|mmetsp:Transcript_19105/g.38747  ORF Transcript_19105/g.38747 Transcript_19105/m.38747 type:complete len:303 (+) Transcript_19105:92-1000(+)|eukprot:CAMPEP_0183308902 /NCGR_PEP_ID=MMETSP0160_2-20130417/22915_1 /TAXON_ID=2839 ORGANISM="Odontella Sinensis, Strain Grunow 1884" /NCGR_SAMPLE_ID=MMETSP0160_2 /ASSEMBLY_ACC=CAM_ASM_000250 /LENGTH=302 /DNA_ID=CAMNT_0025472819 /DNA_START=81 /DNA_END=989 /DNA_ORIENTATION=+
MMLRLSAAAAACLLVAAPASSFAPSTPRNTAASVVGPSSPPSPPSSSERRCPAPGASSPLFMGRAAAVRAATKSKTDAKKAKTNALFGKKIIMAVKNGGSTDPNANRQLAEVIKAAKANSVPVDNINRAIKRASETDASNFSESTFEAYGMGGASMIINVLSDNANRATADVKACVNKRGAKIAEQGSVLFMYDRRGKVEVPAVLDEEEILMAAIDAGCDDMELAEGDEEGTSVVYTEPQDASKLLDAVKSLGFEEGVKMSLAWVSKAPVECSDEDFEKNMEVIDALEELDDVDSVEHNMSN